jgi:4-alpha-glucanotransferase
MNDASAELLGDLAEAAGLAVHWRDYRGVERIVSPETLRAVLAAMELPCASAAQARASLDQLTMEKARPRPSTARAAPPNAYGIAEATGGRRVFALAAQLYGLRRSGGGGLGDFTALAELARRAGAAGADAVAISPVHAPFAADPRHYSPYSPSSRLQLNAWYVDPAELAGVALAGELAARAGVAEALARLDQAPLVDWPAVVGARNALLRALHAEVAKGQLRHSAAADDLLAFRRRGGETLEDHARFEAIHAAQLAHGGQWHWRHWPASLRDPRAPAVADFARHHADEVDFHAFCQWLADRGLGRAQRAARDAGMAVGLIADLAVGTDGGGSHAWSRQHDVLVGASVGAPPDDLNARGQNWGLTTFSPRALAQHDYAPFRDMLRATLRHAGGLRIDHVLGLNRLWLIPEGAEPTQGVYLRYPLEPLLAVIASESRAARAVIVGEDLGTVPDGFRERLAQVGLMGLRVLGFEREYGLYVEPSRWPAHAVATTSTHDIATVAGWWQAHDLEWRERLQVPAESREQRATDRRALWNAFVHAGVASGPVPEEAAAAVDAAVRFVARTPAPLAVIPLEDLAGAVEQPNLPGTIDEHPNWRRRLALPVERVLSEPAASARLAALREERPRR